MTTMTLETLFRAAVDDGRLVNMTLWRTAQGWQASMSTGFNPWKVRIEDDPITGAPRRKSTPDTESDEFAEYVDRCIVFGAELGIEIPPPTVRAA